MAFMKKVIRNNGYNYYVSELSIQAFAVCDTIKLSIIWVSYSD